MRGKGNTEAASGDGSQPVRSTSPAHFSNALSRGMVAILAAPDLRSACAHMYMPPDLLPPALSERIDRQLFFAEAGIPCIQPPVTAAREVGTATE